ncbi:MAG TPA: TIGR00730 family Rossman fold protein [Solirubrobacteraceae bacterium]|jgi:uncharacterized protein (TIGR00730 family)|nr:TIGR00730 family Rossman fold protein [Solirubrobacteraceae bacterium]
MTRTDSLLRVRLCIFCGSSPGARPDYGAATEELARLLAERGIGIVYGGASVGLMGLLADTALAAGGEVIGVIPAALQRKEIGHTGLTHLEVVSSMHERKALMAELSNGFIALPGGSGTLEELFEVFTWSQLGLHRKACALLNVAGYYAGLETFLDHAVNERFLRPEHRAMLLCEDTPEAVLDALERFEPPVVDKWLDRAAQT